MKGIDVKRGVAATMERVVANSGSRFKKLEVNWYGKSAAINFERDVGGISATVYLPAIDELAEVDRNTFNNLIGFALHEGLGHAVYTDNLPWDEARFKHGQFVHNLINGLEDPRIEQRAIDSGYAPNAKYLFENLLNSMLDRDGYVEPDDIKNIPFLLAVEGRRLNGYSVNVPSIIDQSPLAVHLHEALRRARNAFNTQGVVTAALDLYEQIKQAQPPEPPPPPPEPPKPPEGDENGDGKGKGKGDSEKPPTGDSDKPQVDKKDKPSKSSDGQWSGSRPVDPAEFIKSDVKARSMLCKDRIPRPFTSKPVVAEFTWS